MGFDLQILLYREAGGDFLKFLCDNPGVDCSDLLTAIAGISLCIDR